MFSFSRIASFVVVSAFVGSVAFAQTGKICINPGHGGTDSGAVGNGQYEKTNVLNTGLKFRTWMNKDTNDTAGGGSWNVLMTRSTDITLDLAPSVDIANNAGANRFMSIHNNACCGANGTETFCWGSGSANSYDLRNKVQQRTLEAWGLTNRGNKTANFYVIKYTNMPAELAELGFIDNAYDSTFVGNATQQDKVAKYHLFALQNHYGLTAYTPGAAPAPVSYIIDNSNGTFSASASWSTGSSAADKYGADYRYHSTGATADPANYAFTVAGAGNYDVSAWWSAGTNRSTAAKYIMPDGASLTKNQQANGGAWNLLITYALANGNNTIKVDCVAPAGFVVIADAIKVYGPK